MSKKLVQILGGDLSPANTEEKWHFVYSLDYIVGCQIQTDAIGDVYSLEYSGMSNSN